MAGRFLPGGMAHRDHRRQVPEKYRAEKEEDNWIWSAQGIVDMHRPEKWGYVQFTKGEPGKVKFNPDVSAPARMVLQEIYYAQKDFSEANKRWAATLSELTLPESLGKALAPAPERRERLRMVFKRASA